MPVLGNIQDQVGWVSEEPDLIEHVPAPCRGIGLDKVPFQAKLFYNDFP